MELVLTISHAHPYFSLKVWAKKCALYTAKYSSLHFIFKIRVPGSPERRPVKERLDLDLRVVPTSTWTANRGHF